MIIYKATNKINGKKYIGQTTQGLERRKAQHLNSPRWESTKNGVFAKAINKYGAEAFEWEIIDRASSIEELNEKEKYWIKKENSLVDFGEGYNSNTGGDNGKHSELTKFKIGHSQKGQKNHMYGKSGELNHSSKPVLNVDTGIIYGSACECARELGLQHSHISSVCRGERATTGGYTFRYLDSNGDIITPKNTSKPRAKRVLNKTTGVLYDSLKEAAASKGANSSYLSRKLKNSGGTCEWKNNVWTINF